MGGGAHVMDASLRREISQNSASGIYKVPEARGVKQQVAHLVFAWMKFAAVHHKYIVLQTQWTS